MITLDFFFSSAAGAGREGGGVCAVTGAAASRRSGIGAGAVWLGAEMRSSGSGCEGGVATGRAGSGGGEVIVP